MKSTHARIVQTGVVILVLCGTDAWAILPPAHTGNFYVSNWNADEIAVYDRSGTYLREFSAAGMNGPRGIVFAEDGQIFVANEHTDEVFVFDENEQFVTKFTAAGLDAPTGMALSDSGSPLLFLLGKGDIRRDFDSVVENSAEKSEAELDTVTLKLTPKVPNPEFIYLILEIEKDSFLIRKLTVVEPIGQQNEYALKNMKENVRIPNKQFELKIPSNVEVIEQ